MAAKRRSGKGRRRRAKEGAAPAGRLEKRSKHDKAQELPVLHHVRDDLRKIGITAAITAGMMAAAAMLARSP